jgi:hypothetical protein
VSATQWVFTTIAGAVVLGIIVTELTEVSVWLADRLIPIAVRLWTRDEEMREVYAEEWRSAPGKVFKLAMALSFLGVALGRSVLRTWLPRIARRSPKRPPDLKFQMLEAFDVEILRLDVKRHLLIRLYARLLRSGHRRHDRDAHG